MKRATLAVLLMTGAAACFGAAPQGAQQPTFGTPQEAAQALVDAASHDDSAALLKLFGPGAKDIVESGDAAEDKQMQDQFAKRASAQMRIEPEPGNPTRATVVVGDNDWPFPVQLVRKNGKWFFDAQEGRMEILARRIGRNEMNAMDVCRAYVEAQMEYASHDRDADGILKYAQKIISSPGKKDGLYTEGESGSLVPQSFAEAAEAMQAAPASRKRLPYHGYYFHVLKAQGPNAPGGAADYVVNGKMIGGFALVAWPAEYGVSGIKTLLVSHDGAVYEKDLGPATETRAQAMTRFDPDKSWARVEGE